MHNSKPLLGSPSLGQFIGPVLIIVDGVYMRSEYNTWLKVIVLSISTNCVGSHLSSSMCRMKRLIWLIPLFNHLWPGMLDLQLVFPGMTDLRQVILFLFLCKKIFFTCKSFSKP